MVKSMTGYGRGDAAFEGRTITAELRSVNNRYLDCTVKMPRAYIFAEDAIKARVQKAVTRGKVDVFFTIVNTGGEAVSVTVNKPLARAYMEALFQLHQMDRQMIESGYHATDLARFPDVLVVEKQEEDLEALKSQLLQTLELALHDFDRMRQREGERLREDILSRVAVIEEKLTLIEDRSPQTVAEYRAKLEARMNEVLANTQIDPARILTEAAIFADKVAVAEETVRLRSHISQLWEMLSRDGAIGRKLDFLIQEFNREANTIGSKCSDIEITRHVVDMKAEIEKIREQVQNIE